MAYLDVLLKPQIDVNPLSVTLEEGQDTILTCSILIPKTPKDSAFQWFRWNDKVNYNYGKSKYIWKKTRSEEHEVLQTGSILHSCRSFTLVHIIDLTVHLFGF